MTDLPRIRKLDETVVNRIAAGEVIQRPANALKELLENSLDARSTNIQIVVKDGGLKFLQIQDNGIGIKKEDLEIVCERFTTSKLTKFEDLSTIATYGFRGEALASISHVAHLTIVSKTADSQVGYKASYEDSKLRAPPKACASNQGTQITVEDLFYNVTTRRKALVNYSEEHGKIADVVSKYAIHNSNVGFTLKKQGESTSDIRTPPNSNVVDNIRTIYGSNIGKELLKIDYEDDNLKFSVSGYFTNVSYSNKKLIFLLFINHRLVSSTSLKRVIEQCYSNYLPKNGHPFVYLSINLEPRNVDVNVHPTKHEVHFLHEDLILEKTKTAIENILVSNNTSRVFYTQTKLPTLLNVEIEETGGKQAEKKIYDHNLVRTDAAEQKLDKFFKKPVENKLCENETVNKSSSDDNSVASKRVVKLKSILQLRTEVENKLHTGLRETIKNCSFVGVIDSTKCLLQYSTKLYLCNTQKLTEELFYQIILYEFANFGVLRFTNLISIKELCSLALNSNNEEVSWTESDGTKEEIAENVVELLIEKAPMLEDYFSIEISPDGNLCTLPLLLDSHRPDLSYLPIFVLRIASEVDWNLEKPCLDGISREIARFYSRTIDDIEESSNSESDSTLSWKWTSEHVLLPALKSTLLPPNHFAQDGTVLEIASLPDLYKVFERC